jgi:hypothetical protein
MLGIPFVNRPDLLSLAVNSVSALHPNTVIIDNSEHGLNQADWPVRISRQQAPLTFSQTMNLLQQMARESGCEVLLFIHNDAEAVGDSAERLLAAAREATEAGRRWGVIFTHYDTLAAFDMRMVRAVGRWDTTLPQYYADNDYYRRVRLAGYETIDTGLPVIHHNNASSTVKSDSRLGLINGVTIPLYHQYYAAKWGGGSGHEKYIWPFNGELAKCFVHSLRNEELYSRLAGAYDTVEGNLLERADDLTHAAQIEALRYALNLVRPQRALETGTGKSLFGYALSHLGDEITLYTFDGDPRCLTGVETLNAAQSRVRSIFTLGDTKVTLQALDADGVGLAWIDGGHDEETALNDIGHAMRLRVSLIMVDDAGTMPEVARAVERALQTHTEYQRFDNPFSAFDVRGMVWIKRK